MQLTSTKVRVGRHALVYLCLFACLTLSSYSLLTDEGYRHRPGILTLLNRPTPGPLPFYRVNAPLHNDPVRFTLRCEKQAVRVGESFDLIITAELLSVSPHLMFFLPGSNAFRLKLLLPPGFEQTGGDFTDYVAGELSLPARPVATYRLSGRFVTAQAGTSFRLLRSYGRANDQDLFVEKATLSLKTGPGKALSLSAEPTRSAAATLWVTTDAAPASARARVAAPTALTVLAPAYNCTTGAITFRTAGGDSTAIRYMAVGITGWTTNPNQYLDAEARTSADAAPFTIKVEQSGNVQSYRWSRQAACADSTAPAPTPPVTPTPACTFRVTTVGSPTATCGSSVSLGAGCSGADCNQVSYVWSGNGLSRTGQSVSFNAPSTNGIYSYTVTATRPGCATQIATALVTVSGCATTPSLPGTDQYPILSSPFPADKRPVLQNSRVRVAIDLGVGAVIREVTDLQIGENMINCMVKSDGLRDPGRDDQISLYGLPDANQRWSPSGKPVLDDIGYNPVQGGDIAGNFSPVLGYGRTNEMLYAKTRGLQWGFNNEPGDYVVEQWIRLEGNVVKRHIRITGNRPDQTRYADTRQQELPCTYTNSAYYQYYVVQGTPYTNAPLVNVNTIPNLAGTGKRLDQHRAGVTGPYDIDASEPWIVAVRPSNNRGIALHTPFSHEFKVGLFNEIGFGPAESSNAGYIANGVSLLLDRNGVYEFDVNMVVGTLDEIRRTVNTLPRSETKPNYVFANQATRHGFYYRKGYDQGFPVGDELVITPTDRRFRLISPRKGYQASEFRTVYVRMRAKTPETQMVLDWRKVGQTELQAAQAGQFVTFSVTGDDQYRTIAIPVGNHPQWNGHINEFSIRYINPSQASLNGHQLGVKWISASDLSGRPTN